jgi:hypothetical protein
MSDVFGNCDRNTNVPTCDDSLLNDGRGSAINNVVDIHGLTTSSSIEGRLAGKWADSAEAEASIARGECLDNSEISERSCQGETVIGGRNYFPVHRTQKEGGPQDLSEKPTSEQSETDIKKNRSPYILANSSLM